MRISTAFSVSNSISDAVDDICTDIEKELRTKPDYLMLFHTELYDAQALVSEMRRRFPHCQLQSGTSCQSVMTEKGIHGRDGRAVAAWAVSDPAGSYGVGMATINGSPKAAGTRAILEALRNVESIGDTPSMVWLTATPGFEEEIISGIEEVLGKNVPIFGGSGADNAVSGNWALSCNGKVLRDGVVLAIFNPSGGMSGYFHNGYTPTKHSGVATKVEKRKIVEIDGRPAAQVYNEWTDGLIENEIKDGGKVLLRTNLAPLGRFAETVGEIDHFNLSHPEGVLPDGSITLFTDIVEGERIFCMSGERKSLISRAGRIAETALLLSSKPSQRVSGALVIFCAGCMLTVGEEMDHVVVSINKAIGGVPFIGGFTFGEQGCFANGHNGHGNLMISVVEFFQES